MTDRIDRIDIVIVEEPDDNGESRVTFIDGWFVNPYRKPAPFGPGSETDRIFRLGLGW